MSLLKKNLFFLILFSFVISFPNGKIVLQNGLNNYEGCDDAQIYLSNFDSSEVNTNYGDDSLIIVHFDMV